MAKKQSSRGQPAVEPWAKYATGKAGGLGGKQIKD